MGPMVEFQQDLKNGLGLNEALIKHGLTFKQAFDMLEPSTRKSANSTQKKRIMKTRTLNIQQQGKYFLLRKNINRRTKSFGTYDSLDDAIQVRDYLIEHGWNEVKLRQACKELNIKRRGSK